jgi:hypothetical protein
MMSRAPGALQPDGDAMLDPVEDLVLVLDLFFEAADFGILFGQFGFEPGQSAEHCPEVIFQCFHPAQNSRHFGHWHKYLLGLGFPDHISSAGGPASLVMKFF